MARRKSQPAKPMDERIHDLVEAIHKGARTAREISVKTGATMPTTRRILQECIRLGLVQQVGQTDTGRTGRPARLFDLG